MSTSAARKRVVVALQDADWVRFRDLVKRATGISTPDSRRGDMAEAVASALEETGLTHPSALCAHLANARPGDASLENFISRLTINETHFFRNAPQFRAIEQHVLPEIVERKRSTRKLRIWSAACSSGEEPYSLAMAVRRVLGPAEIGSWDIEILGTDIDTQILARAREARYGGWSFREVPADVRRDFFVPALDGRLEVIPAIRRMVRFAPLNFMDPTWPAQTNGTAEVDLILCRNVLIYFEPPTVREIVGKLFRSLAPDGWLVVGHAEPSQETFASFETKTYPGTVLYRKPTTKPAAAANPAAPEVPPRAAASHAPSGRASTAPPGGKLPFPRPDTGAPPPLAASRAGAADAIVNARRHADKREFVEAERWIASALQRDPVSASAHYLRGILHQERGRLDDALTSLRRSTFLDESHTLAHFAMAAVLSRLGQPGRAEKQLATVEQQLTGRRAGDRVRPDDDMTVGRLLDLVVAQRGLAR